MNDIREGALLLQTHAKKYFDALMDLVFPLDISCHFCKGSLEKGEGKTPQGEDGAGLREKEAHWTDYLCRACIEALPIITDPSCTRCSIPMYDHKTLRGISPDSEESVSAIPTICEDCVRKGDEQLRNLSFVTYDEDIRRQIYRYKYKDQTYLARVFALMMKESLNISFAITGEAPGKAPVYPYDLILSIPLHKKRQKERGYNQAHLLAKYLSEATEIPYEPRGLLRAKETKKMHTLSRTERRKNLAEAFAFSKEEGKEEKGGAALREMIRGKHLLIVDDIYTTGTTAESLGHLLKSGNPESITVITIARVIL